MSVASVANNYIWVNGELCVWRYLMPTFWYTFHPTLYIVWYYVIKYFFIYLLSLKVVIRNWIKDTVIIELLNLSYLFNHIFKNRNLMEFGNKIWNEFESFIRCLRKISQTISISHEWYFNFIFSLKVFEILKLKVWFFVFMFLQN